VYLQRRNHVIRAEGLAVVEGDALAQFEGPGLGVGRSAPALGQFADQLAVGPDFGQTVEDAAMRHHDHETV